MDADGNLAASSQCGESGAFCSDGIAGGCVVEEGYGGEGLVVISAGLDAEGALACSWTEVMRLETLADPLGLFKPVEAGSGEQDGVDLAFFEFAEAGVDIAAEFDGFNIWAQG